MILTVVLVGFFALKTVARNIADAMNPPIPRYAGIDLRIEEEEIPDHVKRQNEILERVEDFTRDNPVNVAELVRNWLRDIEEEAEK